MVGSTVVLFSYHLRPAHCDSGEAGLRENSTIIPCFFCDSSRIILIVRKMSKKLDQEKHVKRHNDVIKNLIEANRNAHEAAGIGTATMEELEDQNEKLQDVEITLTKNEEVIDKSLRKLRGMTWSGSLFNACSDVVQGIQSLSTKNATASSIAAAGSSTDEDGNISATPSTAVQTAMIKSKYSSMNAENSATAAPTNNTSTNNVFTFQNNDSRSTKLNQDPAQNDVAARREQRELMRQKEDALLQDLSRVAATLHQIGVTMGTQLETSAQHIENIEEKTDRVHQKTVEATVKSSKIQRSYSARDSGTYLGTYQFYMKHFNKLLGCNEKTGDLILTSIAGLHTLFRVYLRYDTLCGLQSVATSRYVGTTMWGNIAVLGNYFGSQEESYIEFTHAKPLDESGKPRISPLSKEEVKETGILFLARNWGSGGWLKVSGFQSAIEYKEAIEEAELMGEGNGSGKGLVSNSLHRALLSNEDVIITETTSTPLDKTDRILFLPIKSMKE